MGKNIKYGIVRGIKLIENSDKVLEHIRRTKKSFEFDSVLFWLNYCRKGNVLLDIGAYTGLYTMLALKNGSVCFGYEPNPSVFRRAITNCNFNELPNDKIFNFAVGESEEVQPFFIPRNIELSSSSGLTKPDKNRIYNTINVNTIMLDEIYSEIKINCIKIDVEGSELSVLKGARKILEKFKPALIIEALTKEQRRDIIKYLKRFGYKNVSFYDDRNLIFKN